MTNYYNKIFEEYSNTGSLTYIHKGQVNKVDSYKILSDARQVAHKLECDGVKRGELIGIHGSNSYEWILLDLACVYLGAVTVGMDTATGHNVEKISKRYGIYKTYNSDTDLSIEDIPFCLDDKLPHRYRWNEGCISSIRLTSGSTGIPKAIPASVESVDDSIISVQKMFNHTSEDRLLVFLPLYMIQQRYWVYSMLVEGFDLILTSYHQAMHSLKKFKPTVVMGVPEFYETILQNLNCIEELPEAMGGEIRYLWTGSAPISKQLIDDYMEMGIPIYQGYGTNETCIVTKNNPEFDKAGSVGKVVDNKAIFTDLDGQIYVHCKYPVANHYLDEPASVTSEVFIRENMIRTGDVGHIDEDSYLYITGRTKELLVLSSGRKLAPRPIEEALNEINNVSKSIVFLDKNNKFIAVLFSSKMDLDLQAITEDIKTVNKKLTRETRVTRFITEHDSFLQSENFLTSQMKLKREMIVNKYTKYFNTKVNEIGVVSVR